MKIRMLDTIEKPWDIEVAEDSDLKGIRRVAGRPYAHVVFKLRAGEVHEMPEAFVDDLDRIYGAGKICVRL